MDMAKIKYDDLLPIHFHNNTELTMIRLKIIALMAIAFHIDESIVLATLKVLASEKIFVTYVSQSFLKVFKT